MAVYISQGGRRFSNTSLGRSLFDHLRRNWWKNIQYETRYLFTLTLTNKCTLRCDHCFEEAGPEKTDFINAGRLDELAEESIEVFQKYPRGELRITGGDPFLHPDLFEIISSFSKRKEKIGYNSLDVETNGRWAVDDKTTREIIDNLKKSGATLLSMTISYYHKKEKKFNNDGHFDRIEKICSELDLGFRHISVGMPISYTDDLEEIPEIVPIGRARNLPEDKWGYHLFCRAEGCRLYPPTQCHQIRGDYSFCDEITLGPTGNIYPCNSGKEFEHVTLALGNISAATLPEIIRTKNPLVEMIREKGLRSLTKIAGLSFVEHWQMYDKFSPCGLCHEMLREYGKDIRKEIDKILG